jgi:hypothetical protein
LQFRAVSRHHVHLSAAIFLILEMYMPFQGLMQLSSAPLRNALAHLGQ